MNKVIVKQIRKPMQLSEFEVYAIVQGEERMIKVFCYKPDADPNDKYWGENTAREEALEFAKRWEQLGGNPEKEVIYQTPDNETQPEQA